MLIKYKKNLNEGERLWCKICLAKKKDLFDSLEQPKCIFFNLNSF